MSQNKEFDNPEKLQIDNKLNEIARKVEFLQRIQRQIDLGAADAEVLAYQMLAGVSILEEEFEGLQKSVLAQVTVHGTLEDWANPHHGDGSSLAPRSAENSPIGRISRTLRRCTLHSYDDGVQDAVRFSIYILAQTYN